MKGTYRYEKLAKLLDKLDRDKPDTACQRLAKSIGVSASAISHILHGRRKPTPEQSKGISKFVSIPETDFWIFR